MMMKMKKMTMKKMRMMMMRREMEDDEETLIGSSPPSPDLQTSFPSTRSTTGPPTMPPTMKSRRRNLIRQIADAVVDLARSVTAAISGSSDNILTNSVNRTNRVSNHTTEDEFKYDARKCVVGSERTYCLNCRRYHHARMNMYE